VLASSGEDINVSLGLIDRCLTLNPSCARGWHWSALIRVFAGQPDVALAHFQTYLRLSPRGRMGRLEEAREIVGRLRAITLAVMEPATRYRNPELRELFLSGLRLAAGEEG
jgi:predicted TPR repeat methyltransferase